jgi:hypothetical protein
MRSLYIPKLLTGFLILFSLLGCNNSQTPSEKEIADADISGRNDSLEQDRLFQKYKLDKIVLPEGFKIQVYAEVPNARSMTLSPAGTLFVGTQKNSVYIDEVEGYF